MADDFWDALADTLIPGDGAFPSASVACVVERFRIRLQDLRGDQHLAAVANAFAANGPFLALDEAGRIDAVQTFADSQHVDFEEMLAVLYLSYYESTLVTAAIQGSGLTYHNPPQPTGYAMSAFNPDDPLEQPGHNRGRYVPTDAVRRVELGGLAHLAAAIDRP